MLYRLRELRVKPSHECRLSAPPVPILLDPAVLVLGPFLLHPRPTEMSFGGVVTLAVVIVMIVVVRRASLNKYQQRIDQLGVVAEKQ
jgi:hypothetical protein